MPLTGLSGPSTARSAAHRRRFHSPAYATLSVDLDPGESINAEPGAMVHQSNVDLRVFSANVLTLNSLTNCRSSSTPSPALPSRIIRFPSVHPPPSLPDLLTRPQFLTLNIRTPARVSIGW